MSNVNFQFGMTPFLAKAVSEKEDFLTIGFDKASSKSGTFSDYLGFLALFAYTNDDSFRAKADELLRKKFLLNVYHELEQLPQLDINGCDVTVPVDALIQIFRRETIDFLNSRDSEVNTYPYSLEQLFCQLVSFDLVSFEKWITSTERMDLKICFIHALKNKNNIRNITVENLEDSNTGILQAYHILICYPVRKYGLRDWNFRASLPLDVLLDSKLPKKAKLLAALDVLAEDHKEGSSAENDKKLEIYLQKIATFITSDINWKDFSYMARRGSPYILIQLLNQCKEGDWKRGMFETYKNELIKAIDDVSFLNRPEIEYANELGKVILCLADTELIEKKVKHLLGSLSFPYEFSLDRDWHQKLLQCLLYLCVLWVNKQDCKKLDEYIRDFHSLEQWKYIYEAEQIENILKQIED